MVLRKLLLPPHANEPCPATNAPSNAAPKFAACMHAYISTCTHTHARTHAHTYTNAGLTQTIRASYHWMKWATWCGPCALMPGPWTWSTWFPCSTLRATRRCGGCLQGCTAQLQPMLCLPDVGCPPLCRWSCTLRAPNVDCPPVSKTFSFLSQQAVLHALLESSAAGLGELQVRECAELWYVPKAGRSRHVRKGARRVRCWRVQERQGHGSLLQGCAGEQGACSAPCSGLQANWDT